MGNTNNHLSIFSALDYAHTGMCVIKSDYTVLFWNKCLSEWTSITKNQITGKNICDFCPVLKENDIKVHLDEVFKGNQSIITPPKIGKHLFPAPLSYDSQRIQHITISSIPSADNDDYYALFAIEDITELTQKLAELDKARHDAEMANRSKSDFLANMSHEIRTPMNGILGMCDILMRSGLNEEQQSYALMIERSGRALLAIINDILDFSKIEAGKMNISATPCDIKKTINDLIEILSFTAEKKEIVLTCEYLDSHPRYFIADEGRIRQVLMNLISNAIKFTECGSVTVSVNAKHLDNSSALLQISVKDTGIGIADEIQPILFNKFIQVDSSLTRRFQGTGLGLAISKQLCKLMNGDIALKSQLGEGSEFIVSLPLQLANNQQIKGLYDRSIRNKINPESLSFQAQILLVEDNQINQAVAVHILKSINCIVEVAENGQDAVEIIKHKNFDAIFMDCQMPVLDGYSATRIIRNFEKTAGRHTPIIAMTAHTMEGDRDKCLKNGMDDYIPKPVESTSLVNALEKFCPHRKSNNLTRLQPSILIADDEIISLRELNEIVKHVFPSSIINHATDGIEACMHLGNFRPDIFLCDIMIPHMDGEAVISYMKRNLQFANTRIIVVTGLSADDPSVCRIKEMGVAGIIYKPIGKEKLSILLHSIYSENVTSGEFQSSDFEILKDISIDYRGLVECSMHGIGVLQNNKFIYGNAALSRIFKTTVDKILKMEYTELFSVINPEDQEIAKKLFEIHPSSEKTPNRRVIRFFTSPDELLFVDIYSCLTLQSGKTARLIMATDITDWIDNKEESIFNFRNVIERSNIEWTGFITLFTSEFSSPLSTIIGASRIIQCDSLTENQLHQTALIENSASLIAALINDLNEHSIDTLNHISVNDLSFDLYSAIHEVTKFVSPRIFSHNLEFIVKYDNQLNRRFIGDPARIRQLLTHLISYAIKETNQGYIVLVISQKRNEPYTSFILTFSIQYTGTVPEQVTNTNTDTFCSNLQFAKSISIALGGKIEFNLCDQNPQYSFTITLESNDLELENAIDLSTLKDSRILYASSDQNVSSVLIEQLKMLDIAVKYCTHIENVEPMILSSLNENDPFQILILDYPQENQKMFEITQMIKKSSITKKTSILLLANKGKKGDAVKAKLAGFDGYLVKPVFPMELEKTCALMLSMAKKGNSSDLVTRHTVNEMTNEVPASGNSASFEHISILLIISFEILREHIITILSSFKCNVTCIQNYSELVDLRNISFDLIIIDWNDILKNNDLVTDLKQLSSTQFKSPLLVPLVNNITMVLSNKSISDNFYTLIEKPVLTDSLRKVLDSICTLKIQDNEKSNDNLRFTKLQSIPEEIISIRNLLERLGNDIDFAVDLLIKFSNSLPMDLQELESAYNCTDFKKLELVAHRIKGAARNLSANEMMTILQELEHSSKMQNINTIKTIFPQVKLCSEKFISYINTSFLN